MVSLMPYIGGKHRAAREIARRLHATGAELLVEVFGGSAAVMLNAGFTKRVYNDACADLAHLMRVLADPERNRQLKERLRWTPVCRRIFDDDYRGYLAGGFSFANIKDPIERARATLYRQLCRFGGKTRSGGFSISTSDLDDCHPNIKEVQRLRSVLAKLEDFQEFFGGTAIENLDYQQCIALYGDRIKTVLFVDPPYDGTENYYSQRFCRADHVFLAAQLAQCRAAVVATYYETPLIRELYPERDWTWERICVTRNCQWRGGKKPKCEEVILTKKRGGA
ncbi:MAG: DNA adenine methylase [Kiritimatiellae bacterium]|nr:DNA adenine methylase [Kiritimatiellia bacterium]